MSIRDTDPSDLGEIILTCDCTIEHEGKVGPLVLSVMRTSIDESGEIRAKLRLECEHFDRTITTGGRDDFQAVLFLLHIAKSWLHLIRDDGFEVWKYEKGDFDFFDFWSYQKKPSQFCLQSAYQDALADAFHKASEGKFLMPSHRVAIELDRPGVTTYEVQPDGSDKLAGLCGPDDMQGISPDELCRRVGRMILRGSKEGRELLDRRRASGDYPTAKAPSP